jgi:hypothetical protein
VTHLVHLREPSAPNLTQILELFPEALHSKATTFS